MSSKLDKLISDIKEKKIDTSNVKDVKRLIQSLMDLNSMIGHKRIKDSIAEQTRFLIGMLGKPECQQDFMLNTVIYGPPGIGKTTIGIHLSRIWSSLGYLKGPKLQIPIPSITQALGNTGVGDLEKLEFISYFILGTYIVGSLIYLSGKKVYEKYGLRYVVIYTAIVVALLLAISYYTYQHFTKDNVSKLVVQQTQQDSIKIVSRADFVSEYLGQTAIKTNNLLRENIGKVLFIDEAYSLYEGREDPYGIEALTALNKFLSEHPREIIIIFAGYEETMKKTIFKVQQGLSRRCMWVFNCEPYTASELFLIFKQQIERSGWKIKQEDEIKRLFQKNYSLFKNYGGDTERLCNFAKIKHFDSNKRNYIIDAEDVEKGIKRLETNDTRSDVK